MTNPVTYELAKLLKEKSYPLSNIGYGYNDNGNLADPCFSNIICEAPTIAEVVMWLYKEYKIWISVYEYKDHAADVNDKYVFKSNYTGMREFGSPEEAYEAAIKYCLTNLI